MAFNIFQSDQDSISDINMTPLVDVMLVLLILFIITIPVINHAVKLDLPKAISQPNQAKQEAVQLDIDANGAVFWNKQPMVEQELTRRFKAAALLATQPEIHLHADKSVRYEAVAQVISSAQREGVQRIGFVTDPKGTAK